MASTRSRVARLAPTSQRKDTAYFSSVAGLATQSARKTTLSGVRKPTMSKEWPGRGMASISPGKSGLEKGETSLGWARRNLWRRSLGGQPP